MKITQYRIENDVFFCQDIQGFYHQMTKHEIVNITSVAARLFAFLLQNRNEIVERDTLLKKVWEDYGMQSSNNNLNQCLSTLRRIIKSMGIDRNIIETIPKVGLRIAADVYIEEIVEQSKIEIKDNNDNEERRKINLFYTLIILIVLLIISTTVHVLYLSYLYDSTHVYNSHRQINNAFCEFPQFPALFYLFGS